ncbi:MAG: ribokinase [Oscillospiraceae bacterium]|nr:ribokinase [Oscillospiraceae bacterium]
MKILNFGSLNCDYVYSVPHMVQEGETLSSRKLEVFPGGKGLNQSIALARAGAPVFHGGLIGEDGDFLLDIAAESGVDCSLVERVPGRTGHAIIQLTPSGQNCILLHGGANRQITEDFIVRVLERFEPGDLLLMQNEISLPDRLMELAARRGLSIALNPSPCDEALLRCDLQLADYLILNELEGMALSGEKDLSRVPDALQEKFPKARIVLTLGKDGAVFRYGKEKLLQPVFPVQAVDTTGAGDTFTGYFLAAVLEGLPASRALQLAAAAAALAVSGMGAASSIPTRQQTEAFLAFRQKPESCKNDSRPK